HRHRIPTRRSSDLVLVPVRDQHQQRLAYWLRNIAWLGTKTCGKRDFDAERRNAGLRPVTRFCDEPGWNSAALERELIRRHLTYCPVSCRYANSLDGLNESNWQLESISFRPCIERP